MRKFRATKWIEHLLQWKAALCALAVAREEFGEVTRKEREPLPADLLVLGRRLSII